MLQRLRALQGWLLLWIRALLNESLPFNLNNRIIWKDFFWDKFWGSETRRLFLVSTFTHLAMQPTLATSAIEALPMLGTQLACNLASGLFSQT